MKKRLLACILAILIFVMMIPLEAFADSPIVQAYVGSPDTTSVTATQGDAVTLTASSTGFSEGEPVHYQWYKASSPNRNSDGTTVAAIDGAVGTTYTAPTDTVGTYYYYCVCNRDYLSNIVTVVVKNLAVNDTITVNNIQYKITSLSPAEVSVVGNSLTEKTDVTLLPKLNYNGIDYSVTSIGVGAFFGSTSLASVTIPSSVTSIGARAFESCTALSSITIPSGVTSIGDYTFYGCTSLSSITIPSSVTNIGNYAFQSCKALSSITIPSSVTSIGARAFESCTALSSITIPNSVTSIGDYAFLDSTSLSSITIPNSVTSIGVCAFGFCTALSSITISSSVTSIGKNTFDTCTSLKSITIPSNVASVGNYAFGGCTSLSSITILNSVTNIDKQAFPGIPANAVFRGVTQTRPDLWAPFWQSTYQYVKTDTAVIDAQPVTSGAVTATVGSVTIQTPGNDLGNISGVLSPISTATTATLLAAANGGLPGGTYQVVAGIGVTLSGNTETLIVGQPTTISFQIAGDTSAFDMTRVEVVHQYGGSIEVLPGSWNATTGVITAVTTNGASPFVIVAPLKTAVNNPHTSDRLWISLWSMIALIVSAVLAYLFIFIRKRKVS